MSEWRIYLTIIGAVFWFIIGYLGRQPEEAFNKDKVFKTVVAAIIVGVLVAVFGSMEADAVTAASVLEKIGAIAVLEQIWNIILNRLLGGDTSKIIGKIKLGG